MILPTASTTVSAGQSAAFNRTFRSQVELLTTLPQMSCSGLPAGVACNFSALTPVLGTLDSTGTLTITTTAPHTAQMRQTNSPVMFAFALPFFALALVPVGGFRRRNALGVASAVMLAVILSAAGCGGGGSSTPPPVTVPGTPAGTYNISVTATSAAFSRSTNVALTVK